MTRTFKSTKQKQEVLASHFNFKSFKKAFLVLGCLFFTPGVLWFMFYQLVELANSNADFLEISVKSHIKDSKYTFQYL